MSLSVFDTSALLAYFLEEVGADEVEQALAHGGIVSAANWSELAQKFHHMQIDWQPARDYLRSTGISVEPVTEEDAEAAALLWRAGTGLSLADRLCLSLGRRLGLDTITADRAWGNFPNVTLVR